MTEGFNPYATAYSKKKIMVPNEANMLNPFNHCSCCLPDTNPLDRFRQQNTAFRACATTFL